MKRKRNNTLIGTSSTLLVVFFITFFLSFEMTTLAQGDLLIFPKRLVFEGRTRVEKITLSNVSSEPATYNISLIEYRMTEEGKFEKINEPDEGQKFATPFLRIFPRRVILAPGESQTVKVQLKNTEKMEDGEYRSHLYFRADDNATPLGKETKDEDAEGISVKLEAVFGISIATIIRKGESETTTSISEIKHSIDEASNQYLEFNINRIGNSSIYGDISINYISKKNKELKIAEVKGLGVYTPGQVRKVKMRLQKTDKIDFNSGKIEVLYTENEKSKIIAKAELEL